MRKLVILILTILLTACTQLTAEQIVEKANEKWKKIEDFKADITMKTGNETQEFKFMLKKPNKFKAIGKSSLIVFNGTTQWYYNKEKNEVVRQDLEASKSEMDLGITLETIRWFDIQFVGEEEFDGKACYTIKAIPKDKTIEQKMWIDKETWIPLKIEIKGKAIDYTIEYRNVSINTGIADDEFEFVVPENASVKVIKKEYKEQEPEIKVVKSVEEAEKLVGYKVLTPSYTAGFELDEITVFENKVRLKYVNKSVTPWESITVKERSKIKIFPLPIEEKVSIKGYEGYYQEVKHKRKTQILRFVTEEHYITIIADTQTLSKEELIRIAESMV
ncbi:hypothetical protein DRP05_02005 [Archaeoglobales archaeon]|nr:MAG: hypothetical protein DRP05_02005 [Archaeoglobales archaeon]